MRFSVPLCRRVRHDFLPVYIKKQWREQGSHMTARRLRVPQAALGDPNLSRVAASAEDTFTTGIQRYREELSREIAIGATPEELETWRAARAARLVSFSHQGEEQLHLQEEPSLIFEPTRLFSRDIAQVAMLTNTVVREGAPPLIQSLYDEVTQKFDAADASESSSHLIGAVERAILHAHLWQTDEDRLPKRFNPDLLIWKFKSEFGIHPVNVARYLLQNMFRLCELEALQRGLSPTSDPHTGLPARWMLRDRHLETSFKWGNGEGRRVQFSQRQDIVLSSPCPTPLFVHQSPAVDDGDALKMEQYRQKMHLISPLIDLTSTKTYRLDSSDGIATPSYPYPNLITVNVALPNTWSDFTAPEKDKITVAQRQAIGLMHCYASCVATAKRIYGDTQGQLLPKPIAVEAVCTDGVFFDFIAFQLNTLDLPDWSTRDKMQNSTSAHNIAWLDGNHQLMEKRIPKRSMLRNTRYTNLDMSVFYRLFTRYISGANPQQNRDEMQQ